MVRTALVSQNHTDSFQTDSPQDCPARKGPRKGAETAPVAGMARNSRRAKHTTRKTENNARTNAGKTAAAKVDSQAVTAKAVSAGKKPVLAEVGPVNRVSPDDDAGNTLSCAEIKQYAEEWLLDCEYQQHSAATTQVRRVFLKNLLWFMAHREFDECGTPELRQFLHYLSCGHQEPGGRWGNPHLKRPLRPISIKDYHVCLRLFFDWMVREEIIPFSPMQRVERPLVREEVKQPLSREQTEALLRAAKISQDPRRNEAILLMLFDSGVRASELLSLKVKDVDVRSGSFEVTGKGNKKRTCYLGKATVRAVMAYLRKAKLPATAPLFPSEKTGAKIDQSAVRLSPISPAQQ